MSLYFRKANEVKNRVRIQDFVHTTESLVTTLVSYEYFLDQCEDKSAHFQIDMINPSVASINALGDVFQYDMDHVLFDGLKAAMHGIISIYSPSRDVIYFFLDGNTQFKASESTSETFAVARSCR